MFNLSKWYPISDISNLNDDIDQLFGDTFPRLTLSHPHLLRGNWAPAIDISENNDNIIVKADLPGLKKENIQVSVQNDVLVLKGEKKIENEVKKDNALRSERIHGQFYRSFKLPSGVDTNKVKANFKDGVLELTLPKREEVKSKNIDININ